MDQLDTEMRMAAWPRQVVPPSQQVPSARTRPITSRVKPVVVAVLAPFRGW